MIIKANGIDINYINYGNKKGKNLILLHGWGQNMQMMRPIGNAMEHEYNITLIDLPGHGESADVTKLSSIYDYIEIIHDLIKKLNIKNPILLGHSVGGTIALVYSSKYLVDRIIVIDALSLRFLKKQKYPNKQYQKLKNERIVKKIKNITCKTLIVWGKHDLEENVKNAYKLKKIIKNSEIVIYNDSNHFAYLNHLGNLIVILKNFLK